MSSVVSNVRPTFGRGAANPEFDRVRTGLAAAVGFALQHWRLRRERRRLESLDDRTLADIGLGRGQAHHAVRHGRGGLHVHRGYPSPELPSFLPASWTEWR